MVRFETHLAAEKGLAEIQGVIEEARKIVRNGP